MVFLDFYIDVKNAHAWSEIKQTLPAKYNDSTELTADIKDDTERQDFDLKTK